MEVPTKWVADTPVLLKRTNSLRGTAGPRRARLVKEFAMGKTKSALKLKYMVAPVPPTPGPAQPEVIIPTAASLPPSSPFSEEHEVLIICGLLLLLISISAGPSPKCRAQAPNEAQCRPSGCCCVIAKGTGRGRGKSASQPEPRVQAAGTSRPTPSSSQVPRSPV